MTTTSPSPTKQQTQQDTTPVLDEDRVNTVGWFFIQSYYDFFVNTIDNIHKIYHPQASVTHDSFPSENDSPTVQKAKGVEAIKARFSSDENLKKTNRIVITNASFQASLNKNILIVAFGEWSQGDSSYHQFTQTFLLTPGAKENTFDVANDILKFVASNGFKEQAPSEPKAAPVTEEPASVVTTSASGDEESSKVNTDSIQLASTVTDESAVSEVAPSTAEATPLTSVEIDASADETAPTSDDKDSKADQATDEDKAKAQEEAQEESQVETEQLVEDTEPEKEKEPAPAKAKSPSVPQQPMSWADLASQAAAQATKSKVSPVAKAIPVKKANVAVSPSGSTSGTNGKFKKEDWFPIYIRGIRQLDEKNLKEHLSKHFGDLKFFKVNLNIALCDFVHQEAQKKALEAKETTLDGVTFQLEPRESKTGNNYHNTGAKKFQGKDARKDITDVKRNRTDKKVNGSKKIKNESK